MKLWIYVSLLVVIAVQSHAGTLGPSVKAYDKMIKSCGKSSFYENRTSFKKVLQEDIVKADSVSLSNLMYKPSKEAVLFSFFGIYLYREEANKAMPLKLCWIKLFEAERETDSTVKQQKIVEWSHCTDGIYQEEVPLVKEYEACILKNIEERK